jgi:hypothetical protein
MRYGRVGLWLFTLLVIVVLSVSVYDLSRFAETLDHQLTGAHQQIERLRAASASHLADREAAERARDRADALEGQVARSSEELERLKIVVATAQWPTQERELKLDLAAANEEIERLKVDARTAAGHVTALAEERERAEALTRELAEVRNSIEQLKAEVALEQERQRSDNLARELASVRQELEQLKVRTAATVGPVDRNLESAGQDLQRLRANGQGGFNGHQSEPVSEVDRAYSNQEPPTTARRPRDTARFDERRGIGKQSSTRPSDVRRRGAASATNLARVSSAQGRQPGAEPPKPKNQDLPQELRPVW